uniref:Uncharacterized protein n=1 Tax=Cannabis sativa TaxID=3483 RepID=A0A803Q052_CANSA
MAWSSSVTSVPASFQSSQPAKPTVVMCRNERAKYQDRAEWANAKTSTLLHDAEVSMGSLETFPSTWSESLAVKGAASLPTLWAKRFSRPSTSTVGPVGVKERAPVIESSLAASDAGGIRELKSSPVPGAKAIYSHKEYGFFLEEYRPFWTRVTRLHSYYAEALLVHVRLQT